MVTPLFSIFSNINLKVCVGKSQQFGFLLLELLCAISIFMLAVTATGGLLAQLTRYQKVVDERLALLTAVSQLLEAGTPAKNSVIREGESVLVGPIKAPFHLVKTTVLLPASGQSLVIQRCLP